MTFTEWYEDKHDEVWHEDFAGMYGYAIELADKYEAWCKENKSKPVWNG